MSSGNAAVPDRYGTVARLFHWGIAALLLFQIPLAYYMIDLPVSPDKLAKYSLHKSIGMSIFALSALRLAWRWIHPPPPLPPGIPGWQQRLAGLTHALLYFITFAMPVTGWLNSSAANFPVSVFGLLQLPDLVAPDPELHERMELVHRILAYTLMGTVSLHAAAAFWHQWVRHDGVLARMLPMRVADRPTDLDRSR